MSNHRSELQREVVEALINSKAFNFDVIGNVLGKYGARAALAGESFGVYIGRHAIDACIPVERFQGAAFQGVRQMENEL